MQRTIETINLYKREAKDRENSVALNSVQISDLEHKISEIEYQNSIILSEIESFKKYADENFDVKKTEAYLQKLMQESEEAKKELIRVHKKAEENQAELEKLHIHMKQFLLTKKMELESSFQIKQGDYQQEESSLEFQTQLTRIQSELEQNNSESQTVEDKIDALSKELKKNESEVKKATKKMNEVEKLLSEKSELYEKKLGAMNQLKTRKFEIHNKIVKYGSISASNE